MSRIFTPASSGARGYQSWSFRQSNSSDDSDQHTVSQQLLARLLLYLGEILKVP